MKYNNIRLLSLLFIVSFIGFTSCKITPKLTSKNRLENSLLWQIDDPKSNNTSYIFGTIHIIDSADYFLPNGFRERFNQTERVFFEIDMDEMSDMGKVMGLMDKILMSDDKSLKDLISEEDYVIVQQHFEKLGIPLLFFEKMKPMFLEIFALTDMNPNDLQNGKMKSYEMELNEMAKQQQKPTAGLESIEYQLSIFDSIPYVYQAERLVTAIKESGNTNTLSELVKIYKAMDIEAMIENMQEEGEFEEFEDLILNGRNKNWIPIIKDAIKKESCFFAVGAAHLGGEYGVIRLLRKEGYKVSPVNHTKN